VHLVTRTGKIAICAALLLSLSALALCEEPLLSVSFAKDAWNPADWVLAHNPTVAHLGQWVQRDDCIENETPADPAKVSSLEESLTTMVYGKPFTGDCTVTATFRIGPGAAPGIVLAQDWAPDADGRPQYGEFYEAIIYARGINLWHHFAQDGKRTYERTALYDFELKPDTPYEFSVRRKGKALEMTVDGHKAGVLIHSLPEQLFLGVEGCEGVCQVLDFKVTR
jgi:hypothetical protein